jgi:hypothetical protein
MGSKAWDRVVDKIQANFAKAWDDAAAAAAAKNAEAETKAAAAKEARRVAVVAEARKAKWVNLSDAVELIQHELDVTQLDAQETIVIACASREVWSRFVHPNGSEVLLGFLDPHWWQPKLGGLLIQGGASQQTFLEVTANELPYFFIDVEALLAWLAKRGWPAKRGQIEWNYITADYIAAGCISKNPPNPDAQDRSDELRKAPQSLIDTEIGDVYSAAERANQKPPNIIEIAKEVKDRLLAKGYQASVLRIQKLASAPKHKKRRRKVGPGERKASPIPVDF